ncbi:serine/threonine protein kinase [Acinetobacter sp. ANC 4470]|uniref:serine/threonine protein kinase n=1 Tax=Acinetobacter sp. ANC 4470 TaxID=1977881 RepID=UPI001D1776B0|nr:protein kinase [Acinetobacter sp. ANC 4470]
MQFNVEDIHRSNLILKTKPKSLTFGRALYTFEYEQQHYWLKIQTPNVNQYYEAGFLNELAFYQQCIEQQSFADFLLPFQIMPDVNILAEQQVSGRAALIVRHADLLLRDCSGLSIKEIQKILLQLLDAVDQLHQLGWIHADLKREHFVHEQQRVCLIDFEQVQKINSQIALQSLTATPRYMAPELFHGEAKTVQTDIYALGIIIYEWLTGQRLTAKNYQEWAYLHCQRLTVELPKHFLLFKKLLSGMLAKQKEYRFANIYSIKQCLMTEIV